MLKEDVEKIRTDCKEYIRLLQDCPKGYFLYRGFKEQINELRLFTSDLQDRTPLHSSKELHDKVNSIYKKQFGWKIRNGVFCFGCKSLSRVPTSLSYGKQNLMFPIGDFTLVYSPDHFDLFQYLSSTSATDEILQNISFKDGPLIDAIESGKHEIGLSNEISVNVTNYYLIDIKHRSTLAKLIWD